MGKVATLSTLGFWATLRASGYVRVTKILVNKKLVNKHASSQTSKKSEGEGFQNSDRNGNGNGNDELGSSGELSGSKGAVYVSLDMSVRERAAHFEAKQAAAEASAVAVPPKAPRDQREKGKLVAGLLDFYEGRVTEEQLRSLKLNCNSNSKRAAVLGRPGSTVNDRAEVRLAFHTSIHSITYITRIETCLHG